MKTKLYIGSEQADFNEAFNVMFSIGDIRELSFGSCNRSYTLNLPLTKTNRRLLKHINQADVKSEPSGTGRLYLGELLVISGIVKVLGYTDTHTKVIIDSDEWIDALKGKKMTELDLSAYDHVLSNINLLNSWTAEDPVFRYPMIDFGGLIMGESGSGAKWVPNDFIPAISVVQLITKILTPCVITSTWLSSAFAKSLFILGREKLADENFLNLKSFAAHTGASSDNLATGSSSTNLMVTLSKDIAFSVEDLDEGNNFVTPSYTIPETGTYRFKAEATFQNTAYGNPQFNIMDEDNDFYITKNGTAIASYASPAYSGTELIHEQTRTLDTGYVYCEAGDLIKANTMTRCYGNATSGTQSVTISCMATFNNVVGNACRYTGLGQTIALDEMLPEMTQIDFLAAIRDICNLRFWLDKQKRVMYIEPWDQFLSSTVIDLTAFIDFGNISTELISPSYYKNIRLKWKVDSGDKAFEEYLKGNAEGPGYKDIVLSSLYAKEGIETREHPFSSVVTGYNRTLGEYTVPVPRIYAEEPVSPYHMFNRKIGFNTRLIEWKGLTSGFSWNYDGVTQTEYPKAQGVDFASLYTSYWMKLLHYADKGKILTCRMKIKPTMIAQFFTVVANAANEGFRPCYKIGNDFYFMQKFVTDGISAEAEMILKV